MKYKVAWERKITQIAEQIVELPYDEEDSETGYMLRHIARKTFDPRDMEWVTTDEGDYPSMLDAELIDEEKA